jgi:hypothetical protein
MRVRATRDGTYGGFYREGPTEGIPGISGGTGGEVFDIDDKPYAAIDPDTGKPVMEPVLDSRGNPIMEMVMMQAVDEKGNPVVGSDKKPIMAPIQRPRMKPRMWTWFTPEWMEKVPANTPITYEENVGNRGVHASMKPKRRTTSQPATLSEIQAEMGKPILEDEAAVI